MFQNLPAAGRFSKPRLLVPVALAALVLPAGGLAAAPGLVSVGQPLTPSSLWNNCTSVHTRYPHGVGRLNARDHTRSGTPGVTTFKRSTRLYNTAMRYNSDLDRDKDGVACEKR
jgi:Excalibur calcium-binding domain